jgi:hypothetical protein
MKRIIYTVQFTRRYIKLQGQGLLRLRQTILFLVQSPNIIRGNSGRSWERCAWVPNRAVPIKYTSRLKAQSTRIRREKTLFYLPLRNTNKFFRSSLLTFDILCGMVLESSCKGTLSHSPRGAARGGLGINFTVDMIRHIPYLPDTLG